MGESTAGEIGTLCSLCSLCSVCSNSNKNCARIRWSLPILCCYTNSSQSSTHSNVDHSASIRVTSSLTIQWSSIEYFQTCIGPPEGTIGTQCRWETWGKTTIVDWVLSNLHWPIREHLHLDLFFTLRPAQTSTIAIEHRRSSLVVVVVVAKEFVGSEFAWHVFADIKR